MTDRTGLVPDMPEAEYHGGPELSSTGAKRIVTCPAQYRWETDHRVNKAAYDFGHVAHELVLGRGQGYVAIDGNRNTKAVKEQIAEAEAQGLVVLKSVDLERAQTCAAAVKERAGHLFTTGAPEVSAFALDPQTWTPIRARFDWLTEADGRPLIVDLKTTSGSTHPWQLGKTIADFGYHQQAAWYIDTLALLGQPDADFRFVFVETAPPHEVRIVSLPERAIDRGRELNAQALDLFAQCRARNEWPCLHPTEVEIDLAAYAYAS